MSHITAAFQWNIPYLSKVIGANYTAKYKDNNIIDVTVNDDSMLYTKKGINVHLYKQPLPRGAIRKVNGKMVASPELVFLQLANRLDLHRLILLGLQMCSHPVGKPSDAITNKKKLTNLLKNTVGHHGHKKAVQALKYIEDDSASIMESLLFMILSLPHTLGGYGLEGAYMNRKLSLNSKGKLQLEQSKCFVDIFFPISNVAIEYDSYTYHNSPLAQSKDQLRATELRNKGVEVINITAAQLYDKNQFNSVALKISSALGKRIRIRTEKFEISHENLRELLPRKN